MRSAILNFASDLFVCGALKGRAQDFLLGVTEVNGCRIHPPGPHDFSRASAQRFDQALVCVDHDREVAGRLLARQARKNGQVNRKMNGREVLANSSSHSASLGDDRANGSQGRPRKTFATRRQRGKYGRVNMRLLIL